MKTKPSGLIAGGHSTSAFEISLSYMCRRFFLSTIRPSTQEFGDNPDDFDGLSRTCGDLNQHIVYYRYNCHLLDTAVTQNLMGAKFKVSKVSSRVRLVKRTVWPVMNSESSEACVEASVPC
jgi:hypothetical protein